ncbi:MAG: DUF5110 domain-containing protein [Spirochaetes bacterium]|nr:DUF5110 domain-containing protein [Spirochaetota bacterium]
MAGSNIYSRAKSPKKARSLVFKNIQFTFYSHLSLKIDYSPLSKFINKDLFVTDIKRIENVGTRIIQKGDRTWVFTSRLKIQFREKKGQIDPRSLRIFYRYNKKYKKYVWGMKDRKNLKGSALDLLKFPIVRKNKLTDGVLSREGYFAFRNEKFTFWTKERDWALHEYYPGYEILIFIGYGDDFDLGLKEYARIFGNVPMVPKWVFGFWYSRWYHYHQNDFIRLVDKYRKMDIPIDVMVVDTNWRKNVWNGYDWEKKYFPAPERFIKEMKKRKIKLTLNDHPGYNSSEPLPEDDSHLQKVYRFLKIKSKKKWRCNWSDRNQVKAFCEILLKPKLKMGFHFWWIDGWGADGIYRDEKYFDKHQGSDPMHLSIEQFKTINPQLWLNFLYYKTTQDVYRNKRVIIFSRWGGIGSHRYPVQFSGDTISNFHTIAYEVYFNYTSGNVLTNYWSHDIGGFLGRKIPRELFIRWVQFGCFCPVMRTHSSHGIREPWKFDSQTVRIFGKYVRLRYRLAPYFYRLAFESHQFARPLTRALYHEYPHDNNSYRWKHQYFLGPSILVAPVIKKIKLKKIYFPEGRWLSLEMKDHVSGPCVKKYHVPIDIIPLFIKKGSIIPVDQKNDHIPDKNHNIIQLEVFPDNRETVFDYYEDDNVSLDYLKGKHMIIPLKTEIQQGKCYFEIGKRKGHYNGMSSKRMIRLIFHFEKNIILHRSQMNKRKVNFKHETKLLGEIDSSFHSYKITIPYTGKATCLILSL